MTKELIDAIKADREAGTPGPWWVDFAMECVAGPPEYLGICFDFCNEADMFRIARVPGMEDAIIAL